MTSCIGCGYCCERAICVVGQMVYHVGPSARCPGLTKEEGIYRCQLAHTHSAELAIGAGCCSSLNSQRQALKEKLRELL